MKQACALAAVAAFLRAGAAPPPPHLASYRAIYAVSLERTAGAVLAARGRMAVEFRNTCDGWSTAQRLIDDVTDSDGTPSRNDFIVTAWESKDGRTMRFNISETRNGKSEERQRGSASLNLDGTGRVDLIVGKPAKFALPKGTQFPTAQILATIYAARGGHSAFKGIVFEGGDPTSVNFSTGIIGKPLGNAALAADRAADQSGLLKNVPAWPVLLSYFPLSPRAETPDYEVAAHFFDNGVSGTMSFIYKDYSLRVTLTRLEALHASC
jgi:hypothetical protein